MTETWVMKWCKRCQEQTIHDHRSGTSSKAHWHESECQLCGKIANVTERFKTLDRV